jgi:DNA polymerase III subunit delta'
MKALDWHASEFSRLLATKAALPHALLLSGPRGIGKLAFARALAQALLCETPAVDAAACGTCTACLWVESGTHPDFRFVEPLPADAQTDDEEKKTTIGVNQIRALADFINVSSHRGGPKAIVLHPAEALNANAANALLKNLEEPPPQTIFMLVTHRPHQLLPTIRSRCQHIALSPPPRDAAAAWLAANGVRNPDLALAHMGNAPLLALEIEESEFWAARTGFLRQIAADPLDVLTTAEAAADLPIPYVLAWLQKWSYDVAHYRALGAVRYNPDFVEAIANAAAKAPRVAVLRFHREMVKLQRFAQHPLNARLFVEHVLLAYRDLVERQEAAA